MEINSAMNLDHLAERMGDVATREDAEMMRDLLVESHDGEDTSDLDDAEWMRLLNRAVAGRQSGAIIIAVVNPVSGVIVDRDITALTQRQLDAYAQLMDGDIRERLHDRLAPCSPAEFLAAYVAEVGPDAAGALILGS